MKLIPSRAACMRFVVLAGAITIVCGVLLTIDIGFGIEYILWASLFLTYAFLVIVVIVRIVTNEERRHRELAKRWEVSVETVSYALDVLDLKEQPGWEHFTKEQFDGWYRSRLSGNVSGGAKNVTSDENEEIRRDNSNPQG